ncbi:hypothetical protein [Kordia sp.]|uniref:hypothetical protein n=1 Tax=Kordia sp. TaxID=1965332 RepID=UPI003D2B7D3E
MKHLKPILFTIFFFSCVYACKGQTPLQLQQTYNIEVIGTWESEGESGHKLEFLSNGRLKIYSDNESIDTINYSVVISCNGNMFLRFEDEDSDIGCDIINAINNENSNILPITTEQGKLQGYTKVN